MWSWELFWLMIICMIFVGSFEFKALGNSSTVQVICLVLGILIVAVTVVAHVAVIVGYYGCPECPDFLIGEGE